MNEIHIRPAQRCDAADLAIIDNMAGHGISLWFWLQDNGGDRLEEAIAYGRSRMMKDDSIYGWSNARVAVQDDIIFGAHTSYIMPAPEPDSSNSDQFKRTTSALRPVFELFDQCSDHWFVDSLAVYPDRRGAGTGALLIDDSLQSAKGSGQNIVNLVVEDSNISAFRLYKSRGFEVVDSRPFIQFNGPSQTKEWLLMEASI
ncbi:MAG: GNAT family N-acetyltransferase [Pseudomonadota bacterium]